VERLGVSGPSLPDENKPHCIRTTAETSTKRAADGGLGLQELPACCGCLLPDGLSAAHRTLGSHERPQPPSSHRVVNCWALCEGTESSRQAQALSPSATRASAGFRALFLAPLSDAFGDTHELGCLLPLGPVQQWESA
jgi:hypothetical protein